MLHNLCFIWWNHYILTFNDIYFQHQIECHLGTSKRLIIQYETKAPDAKKIEGWPRWEQIENLDNRKFQPFRNEVLGSLVYIPRLELVYVENDQMVCHFFGGNECKQTMFTRAPLDVCHPPMLNWNTMGTIRKINANRVILQLDSSAFALEKFILNARVSLARLNVVSTKSLFHFSHCTFKQIPYCTQPPFIKTLGKSGLFSKTTRCTYAKFFRYSLRYTTPLRFTMTKDMQIEEHLVREYSKNWMIS